MQYLELILEKHIYVFYVKVLYIEFDECLFRSKKNGLISELFGGIPPNISRVFRYRDLYFFKDNMNLMIFRIH
jgi:hypothetical protein